MNIIEQMTGHLPVALVEASTSAWKQIEDMRVDAARYPDPWYAKVGFWATATYRLGRWARTLRGPTRLLVLLPQKVLNELFHIVYQIDISPHAEIGPGLALIHPRNIMIGHCKIGRNCLIFHEVTLGMNANSAVFPEVGNDVDIYAGARVIGEIRLGNDVKVGANCVVSQSVPDGCTVVVAKSRIVSKGLVDAFGPRRSAAQPSRENARPVGDLGAEKSAHAEPSQAMDARQAPPTSAGRHARELDQRSLEVAGTAREQHLAREALQEAHDEIAEPVAQ